LLASSDYVITSKQKVQEIQYQQETDLRKSQRILRSDSLGLELILSKLISCMKKIKKKYPEKFSQINTMHDERKGIIWCRGERFRETSNGKD
jgi:hypothetical protein